VSLIEQRCVRHRFWTTDAAVPVPMVSTRSGEHYPAGSTVRCPALPVFVFVPD